MAGDQVRDQVRPVIIMNDINGAFGTEIPADRDGTSFQIEHCLMNRQLLGNPTGDASPGPLIDELLRKAGDSDLRSRANAIIVFSPVPLKRIAGLIGDGTDFIGKITGVDMKGAECCG